MKMKKAVLGVVCAGALVIGTVAGTMAYLTATETVTNTFAVGKVGFDESTGAGLDEALVNEYGEKLNTEGNVAKEGDTLAGRVTSNSYTLVPGEEYVKDPIVHISDDSESCWVFVELKNGIEAYESTATGYVNIENQIVANGWTALDDASGVYYKSYTKGQEEKDLEVFQSFTISDSADSVDGWSSISAATNVTVTAYAVQADGFDTAKEAWNATFGA